MPNRLEMEYVPIASEAAQRRTFGLRSFIERWLLRLIRHSCVCPACRGLRDAVAEEKVIEF